MIVTVVNERVSKREYKVKIVAEEEGLKWEINLFAPIAEIPFLEANAISDFVFGAYMRVMAGQKLTDKLFEKFVKELEKGNFAKDNLHLGIVSLFSGDYCVLRGMQTFED